MLNSTQEELESIKRLRDICWTCVFPLFCFTGSLINLFNVYVFVHKEFRKNSLNRFMLAYSIADCLYLSIGSFSFVFKCGSLCDLDNSFSAQVYGYIFIDYITSVLAIFNILIEVFISIQRYLSIINKKIRIFNQSTNKTLLILLITSLIYYLPFVFSKTIIHKELNISINNYNEQMIEQDLNQTIYSLEENQFGKSQFGKIVILIMAAIRNLFFLNLIIVFSILTLFEFRKYLLKKTKIVKSNIQKQQTHVNRNVTLTVVSISFVFICGHLPYAIAFIISIIKKDYLSYSLICFRIFCFLMLFTAHSFNIIIYYFSNKQFRNKLKNIFRRNCLIKIIFLRK